MTVYNFIPSKGEEPFQAELADEMAAFDALPARLREALRESVTKFSAVEVAQLLAEGESERSLSRRIMASDRGQ